MSNCRTARPIYNGTKTKPDSFGTSGCDEQPHYIVIVGDYTITDYCHNSSTAWSDLCGDSHSPQYGLMRGPRLPPLNHMDQRRVRAWVGVQPLDGLLAMLDGDWVTVSLQ